MRRARAGTDDDLDATQAEGEGGEQADRAGAEHGCAFGLPDLQAALDLERLADAFLGDAERFEEDADVGELVGHGDEELLVVGVALAEEAVERLMPRS